jgi:hypothetical protein
MDDNSVFDSDVFDSDGAIDADAAAVAVVERSSSVFGDDFFPGGCDDAMLLRRCWCFWLVFWLLVVFGMFGVLLSVQSKARKMLISGPERAKVLPEHVRDARERRLYGSLAISLIAGYLRPLSFEWNGL